MPMARMAFMRYTMILESFLFTSIFEDHFFPHKSTDISCQNPRLKKYPATTELYTGETVRLATTSRTF